MPEWTKQLSDEAACQEGVDIGDQYGTPQEAWDDTNRADYMLWWIHQLTPATEDSPEQRKLVECCAAIARLVLPEFERRKPGDSDPKDVLDEADRWARGGRPLRTLKDKAEKLEPPKGGRKVGLHRRAQAARDSIDAVGKLAYGMPPHRVVQHAMNAKSKRERDEFMEAAADIVRVHYPTMPLR